MSSYNKADMERRMSGAVDALKHDLSGLRTGRANTALLDPVMVDVYGATMPLNQLASVSAPEPRLLVVQVWDRANANSVEKAIRGANLGLNPISEGAVLRLPLPDMTEDRRKELGKQALHYGEKARVAVRNIRRDAMDALKKAEKDGEISQDEQKRGGDEIQKATDKYIGEIDTAALAKEKEILGK